MPSVPATSAPVPAIPCSRRRDSVDCSSLLAPAIPDWSDRGLRIAGAEPAAVPAVVIEARPGRAVIHRPIHHLVIVLGTLALNHLGRAVAGQKAVAVPMPRDVVFVVRRRLGRRRPPKPTRSAREGNSKRDRDRAKPAALKIFLIAPPVHAATSADGARRANRGTSREL